MGEKAVKRWAALRLLHEEWGVPLELLQQIVTQVSESVLKRAQREKWKIKNTSRVMHRRFVDVFEQHMSQFHQSMDHADFDQKATQALLALSKTLDAIVQTGNRIAETHIAKTQEEANQHIMSGDGSNQNEGVNGAQTAGNPKDNANRTALLDQQLEALVQSLS